MVGPDGFEPSTPRLSSACSNQLSYEPKIGKWRNAHPRRKLWWSRPGSNRRPPACKAGALPTELRPQTWYSDVYKEQYFEIYFVRSIETQKTARFYSYRFLRPSVRPLTWCYRLLRKEVIQPQVPLRLPCYDFVPITSLTLGRRLHCWLTNALRAKPAFMT